jgi:selenocysteine lyase/cysteine desulfurase
VTWHDDARERFPHLAQCLYLNTASAGLSWTGLGAAAASYYDDVMCDGFDARETWRARAVRLRERIGDLVGGDPADVIFLGNTTDGLNLLANSLRWRAGDRVVVAEDEFPSVLLAWQAVERHGGVLQRVPVAHERGRLDGLLAALGPRTRVLAASHVHWETGTRLDLERLGAACRANGTLLVVDGIQALGAVPVDVGPVDAYGAAVFKWLLSGFGLAVFVVKRSMRDQLEPLYRGYLNPPPERSLHFAHWNYPGIFVLEATLAFLQSIGWPRIHTQVEQLSGSLWDRLTGLGYPVATPRDTRAGIVSFRAVDPQRLAARLFERRVRVEQRGAFIRVSPHFYNTLDEIDRFVEILGDVRA